MTKEKDMDIKEALRNEKSFLKFLRHEAGKGNHTTEEKAKGGPHPTSKMLYNYVLGWTSEEESKAIMRHIASCDLCLEEVMRIRGIEKDLHEDMEKWADTVPFFTRLKRKFNKSIPTLITLGVRVTSFSVVTIVFLMLSLHFSLEERYLNSVAAITLKMFRIYYYNWHVFIGIMVPGLVCAYFISRYAVKFVSKYVRKNK